MKSKFRIVDWTSKVLFDDKRFASFEDAEQFLSVKLGDAYEDERGEFEIVLAKGTRATRYLEPNDPRNGLKGE